jgi:hypothetical protein
MKKEMKQNQLSKNGFVAKVVVAGSVIVAGATNAMAAATLTAPTFALDDVAIVAGALVTGLAGFWAIRKGISLIR